MLVLLFLRFGSLCWALLGIGIAFTVMIFRTSFWIGFELWPYGMPIIFSVIAFVIPAAGIALFSQRLAMWMVPLGCPQCGYSIARGAARCPECGTANP
jgi:hypothetical protein